MRRRLVEAGVLALALLVAAPACTPVQGPGYLLSVLAGSDGRVVVVVNDCPDGAFRAESLHVRERGSDAVSWSIVQEEPPAPVKVVLGEVPDGFREIGEPPVLEPGSVYVVSAPEDEVRFRLGDLRRDAAWIGQGYVVTATDVAERCAEELRAAERRDNRFWTVFFSLPVAILMCGIALLVIVPVQADRRRLRAVAASGPPEFWTWNDRPAAPP